MGSCASSSSAAANARRSWTLADYRRGYPGGTNDLSLDKNLRFYRGEMKCRPDGLTIDQLLGTRTRDYGWLESSHGYVQWLFPIREVGVNAAAQVLQPHEMAAIRADPACMARVMRAFDMMLDFYGFRRQSSDGSVGASSNVVILRTDQCDERMRNMVDSPHNFLRVTRILKFLGEAKLEDHKLAWLLALEREVLVPRSLSSGARSSYANFWIQTVYDDHVRAAFERRAGISVGPAAVPAP